MFDKMSQEQKNNSDTKPFTHSSHHRSYQRYQSPRRSQSSHQSHHSYNSYQSRGSPSSQPNSNNYFMQWIPPSEAHKRGVYMFNDKDPLHRAGMNQHLWTNSLLELFDKDNKTFFQMKQSHSYEQPAFSIDLYLAEEEDEIRADCELVKKHLKQDFDALALWHGRQLPLRLRKHVAARRSSTNWDKALQEAAKGFKYRTNLPQYGLVHEILNDEMKEATADNTRMQQKNNFDAWKKYKFDENYDRKYVKISYWLHYYIAQNVYSKFYVCPEWILAQMTFYLGKPISSEYLNGQCESHKNGSSGKSMTSWPVYMYSQEECNECGCDLGHKCGWSAEQCPIGKWGETRESFDKRVQHMLTYLDQDIGPNVGGSEPNLDRDNTAVGDWFIWNFYKFTKRADGGWDQEPVDIEN